MILFQETTPPRQRLDYTQVFQFGISFGHRVAVDPKFLSQWTDGGERLARPQCPRCRGGLDLIHHLEVNRHPGLEIDLEDHSRLTVIVQYNSCAVLSTGNLGLRRWRIGHRRTRQGAW